MVFDNTPYVTELFAPYGSKTLADCVAGSTRSREKPCHSCPCKQLCSTISGIRVPASDIPLLIGSASSGTNYAFRIRPTRLWLPTGMLSIALTGLRSPGLYRSTTKIIARGSNGFLRFLFLRLHFSPLLNIVLVLLC